MFAGDRLRLVAAHLARCNAAGLPEQPNPSDHRADAYAKLRRRLAARRPTLLNRRNCPLTKIQGKRSAHQMLASIPASILNQS